jgi:hypothetical protein
VADADLVWMLNHGIGITLERVIIPEQFRVKKLQSLLLCLQWYPTISGSIVLSRLNTGTNSRSFSILI